MSNKKKKQKKERPTTANISRDPWPEVKEHLRKQVHYSCPIPGCGRPFLTWHHFDPPWDELHHHNRDGMIALCTSCHPFADRGKWTKDELRGFKQNPPEPGIIRDTFGWSERSIVYRLGGNYSVDCRGGIIDADGKRILWEERSPEGRMLFSLDFFGDKGQRLLEVRDNFLSVDAIKVWDFKIDTGGTYLKLWLGERKPGIELQFLRLTPAAMKDKMAKDDLATNEVSRKLFEDIWPELEKGASKRAEERAILDYITTNCLDPDGTVTLVNISRARLYSPEGRLIDIHDNGIRDGKGNPQIVGCDSWNNNCLAFSL